jgi:hypothetical protein
VVDDHDQQVVVGGEAQQVVPEQRAAGQVERLPGEFLRGGERGRQPAVDLHGGQLDRLRFEDHLGDLGAVQAQHRVQHLVPLDDAGEGGGQGGRVERPGQPQADGLAVERGLRVDLFQQPQALLTERGR